MRKLFIVTSNPTAIEQDKLFQAWLETHFLWWHWMNQTWLLVDGLGEHSAAEIRDKATQCFPATTCLVIEISQSSSFTWAGFGPKSETDASRNMFRWIEENWHF